MKKIFKISLIFQKFQESNFFKRYLLMNLSVVFVIFFLLLKFYFLEQSVHLTVIHTDVLNGKVREEVATSGPFKGKFVGGIALISTVINKIKQEVGGQAIVLDAGSSLFGGNSLRGSEAHGNLVITLMNMIQYDAMTLGSNELDNGVETLKRVMWQANFPLLGANIIDETKKEEQSVIKPYVIKNINNIRVGILGLANPDMDKISHPLNIKGLKFRPFIHYARKCIQELKNKNVDMIIVLSDLYNLEKEVELAKKFPDDIAMIVATSQYEEDHGPLIKVGKIPIVRTPRKMKSVGRLDLELDAVSRKIRHFTWKVYPVVSTKNIPDPRILKVIDEQDNILENHVLNRVLAFSEMAMNYETVKEGSFGNFITDLLKEVYQAEISFINSPNLKGMPYGNITNEILNESIPYDDEIFTMTLKGSQIKKILEDSFKDVYFTGILQESGIRLFYDLSRNVGDRVFNITIGDAPLEADREYSVVTSSYLAYGGDQFLTFKEGKNIRNLNVRIKKVIADYIMKLGKINSRIDGRMTRVEGSEAKERIMAVQNI